MKKAISLIEVLISVMLISIVIVSLLQIKENNLFFLQKTKDTTKYNSYISAISLDNKNNIRNKNIFLGDEVKFKDDEIRRELKSIKIKVKDENLDPLELGNEEYQLKVNIKKTHLSIDDKIKKIFYRFSLEN